MQIFGMIILGFIVGIIARAIKPGKDSLGFIYTTLLGIFGSLFVGLSGRVMGFYSPGESVGFFASILGAVALLYIAQFINSRK